MKKYEFLLIAMLVVTALGMDARAGSEEGAFQALSHLMLKAHPTQELQAQRYYEMTRYLSMAQEEIQKSEGIEQLSFAHQSLHLVRETLARGIPDGRTQWIKERMNFLQHQAGSKLLSAVFEAYGADQEQVLELLSPRFSETAGNFQLQNEILERLRRFSNTSDQWLLIEGAIRLARVSKGNLSLQKALLRLWTRLDDTGRGAEKSELFKGLVWQSSGNVDLQRLAEEEIFGGEVSAQEKWDLVKGLVTQSQGNIPLQNGLFQFLMGVNPPLAEIQKFYGVLEDLIGLARQSRGNLELQQNLLGFAKRMPCQRYTLLILKALLPQLDQDSVLKAAIAEVSALEA